ncbi:hypothetical protein D9613_005473 [Agrocybe pediades]|uniref:Rab proteins geranylgeranyltransferase n=1 Tax=Agrocybe pediades TaxID=84607 RepID=A0A8H4VSZ2_9AGAR|nr:hypothetical protein D9613_005473 [Agrocybe pediades]
MEESQFDAVILGTGLVESITAAALSKAGYKVAHIDSNPYYGGEEASLSLDELVQWADHNATLSSNDPSARYQRITRSKEVPSQSRQYSICLRPAVIPALGPLISSLIMSGVAKYSGFRLLECVSVYDSSGRARNVPGSKEDIFKNKEISLIEKRRLMRFLTFAAAGDFASKKEVQGKEDMPFLDFIQSTFSLGSEIASVIAFSLAFCMSADEPALLTLQRLQTYLRSSGRYGSSPFLIGHYGGIGDIAQGFCRASAVSGGVYILARKVVSMKRNPIATQSATQEDDPSAVSEAKPHFNYLVDLEDFPDTLSSNVIVSSPSYILPDLKDDIRQLSTPSGAGFRRNIGAIARCIAIIDQALGLRHASPESEAMESQESVAEGDDAPRPQVSRETPVDTAIMIFPPSSVAGGSCTHSATVLTNGEGNMSTPKGKWIVYISLPVDTMPDDSISAETLLKPYLDALMSLPVDPLKSPIQPLFTTFYLETIPASPTPTTPSSGTYIVPAPLSAVPLPDVPDEATLIAEQTFTEASKILRHFKKTNDSSEEEIPFWPPLPVDDEEEDNEW